MAGLHLGNADHALKDECARALYTAARAAGVGSRQQIRAAVRGFVRRHRRDRSHLAWALRSAGASSALAVALLGLAGQPASARTTLFLDRTGFENPLGVLINQTAYYIAACNLDGDGDLDVVIDGARYFENTGTVNTPAFIERTGSANPFSGLGTEAGLAFSDLDGDGDLDLAASDFKSPGTSAGRVLYFENTGDRTHPAFVSRNGADNPFDGISAAKPVDPALADLDSDGDADLVVKPSFYSFDPPLFFENTGDAANPSFVQRTGSANPFTGGAGTHAPQFGDFDGDGDLDLVGGSFGGSFDYSYVAYVENTGTPTRPVMVERTNAASPFDGYVSDETRGNPAIGDFDGDGDLDVILSFSFGPIHYLENVSRRMRSPHWAGHFPTLADVGANARPALADLDGDGDLDLLAGAADGTFYYYAILTGYAQVFPGNGGIEARTGAANPLHGVDVGANSAPAFADLDGDGDFDLVSGEVGGTFLFFENTGDSTSPVLVPRTGAANPLDGVDIGDNSAPTLGDLDADGDLDLIASSSGGYYGTLTTYYVNTGDAAHPHFAAFTGNTTTLLTQCRSNSRVPALGDLDGDGDLDLVAAAYTGSTQVILCENTGSIGSPAFRGSSSPFAGDWPFVGAPALGDVDGDGDLDAFLGYDDGTFRYVENAVVRPTRIDFDPLVGAPDPFAGQSGGVYETPALGDLDADGDLDLVAGSSPGDLRFYENTGNAETPLFAARTGAANPLPTQVFGTDSAPALGDLDADGDLDLVVVDNVGGAGSFHYYANTGTVIGAAFALRTGAQDPLAGLAPGRNGAPAIRDLDTDGDLDLITGRDNPTLSGGFSYFLNTGSATTPAFVERTGTANPLSSQVTGLRPTPALGNVGLLVGGADGTLALYQSGAPSPLAGLDLGQRSAPALGNLDHFGNDDFVAGSSSGYHAYLLPEPGRGWLFAAGAALLGALTRRARRARA